jgi:hypothetical protein
MKDPHKNVKNQLYLVLGFFGTAAMFWLSWVVWMTVIKIDEIGIRWKGWGRPGRLRWEDISGLGFERQVATSREARSTLKVGLVEAQNGQFNPLPFLSPELYELLKSRYAPLPSEIEAEWFSQPRGADKALDPPFVRSTRGFSGLLYKMVESSSSWTCFKCGEINPPRLRACGKCSHPR